MRTHPPVQGCREVVFSPTSHLGAVICHLQGMDRREGGQACYQQRHHNDRRGLGTDCAAEKGAGRLGKRGGGCGSGRRWAARAATAAATAAAAPAAAHLRALFRQCAPHADREHGRRACGQGVAGWKHTRAEDEGQLALKTASEEVTRVFGPSLEMWYARGLGLRST